MAGLGLLIVTDSGPSSKLEDRGSSGIFLSGGIPGFRITSGKAYELRV